MLYYRCLIMTFLEVRLNMKADTFNAIDRLFGSMQMILKISVYQRNYDWTETNVRRLLKL